MDERETGVVAKVLVQDEWYTPVPPQVLYEHEFENAVLRRTDLLFPGFAAARFKPTVRSEADSARPDYALVEKSYKGWWVVEVEMSHHSLANHVLPQITTLKDATYGAAEAEYLLGQAPTFDARRLTDMMKGQPPGVLVVVERPCPEWKDLCFGRGFC